MGKILVIRGGAIGDFILTLPAIRLLAEELPQAELEVLGYEPIIVLARAGGYAKSTRSIEYGAMASFFARAGKLDEQLCTYFASFDVVVSYLFDPDHFFRDNLKRAGVETLIECSHKVSNEGAPAAEQLAKPLEELALFLDAERAPAKLEMSCEHLNAADTLLGVSGNVIAVHPGSGSPFKNWELTRWRETMERLLEADPTLRFLVSTGEAEEEAVTIFLKELQELALPVIRANRLPLPVLGAALAKCRLYLGHDSGISHLAAAVGTSSILLFGPTSSSIWAPPHEHVKVLEHPSGLLNEITVDAVIEA
ncbi:MAG: glycosyltransferase family 9 protein, partial [Verrucomicrobiales bacterium]